MFLVPPSQYGITAVPAPLAMPTSVAARPTAPAFAPPAAAFGAPVPLAMPAAVAAAVAAPIPVPSAPPTVVPVARTYLTTAAASRAQAQPAPWAALQQAPLVTPPLAVRAAPASYVAPAPTVKAAALPQTATAGRKSEMPNQRDEALEEFLRLLSSRGVLANLPTDASGVLHVGLPFCMMLNEAPLLLPFLAQQFVDTGAAQRIDAAGCDVEPQPHWWPHWSNWAAERFAGRLSLDLRQQDLAREQIAPNRWALMIGAHPEATKGGPYGLWDSILRNVLNAVCPGGRAVFATYFPNEAEAIKTLAGTLRLPCEVLENPYYAKGTRDHEQFGAFGSFRYAVIVSK
eukprot:TRINITY_DN16956_c0_g1_i1.p1 TRINITY_DN16956_c0_g1~~TRINITY_DN16956_c0_g1_i1.p1  ORF type:complete len:344 (+),score=74.58 TRINITY_DN16956_c0_g1_i1:45-1076(+)